MSKGRKAFRKSLGTPSLFFSSVKRNREREIMYLAQLTSEAARDRRVGTGRRRMFGIAEATVGSAAFLDQQFAPHTLQRHHSLC